MTTTIPDVESLQPEASVSEPQSASLPSPVPTSSRCAYRFSNGKRCRRPGLESQSGLSFRPESYRTPVGPQRLFRPLEGSPPPRQGLLLHRGPSRIPPPPPHPHDRRPRLAPPRFRACLHQQPAPSHPHRRRKRIRGREARDHLRSPPPQTQLTHRKGWNTATEKRHGNHDHHIPQISPATSFEVRQPCLSLATRNSPLLFPRLPPPMPSAIILLYVRHGARWHESRVTSHESRPSQSERPYGTEG